MVLVQNWPFFEFIFLANIVQQNVLSYSRTKKRLSWLKKQEVKKIKKLSFFQRGYSIDFVRDCPVFQFFFICQYRPAKCVLSYSRTKKRLSWLKKQTNKKIKKLRFFSKGLDRRLSPKLAIFAKYFFRRLRPAKCALWYSITKKKFLGYTNNRFYKAKYSHYTKGSSPWFWSRIGHFSIFFLFANIGQQNVFYHILERKNAFLG